MIKFQRVRGWFLVMSMMTSMLVVVDAASSQLIPDRSLPGENSRVREDVQIRGDTGDRIRGGAVRGRNLFHSFEEFNVRNNQRVYFDPPNRIDRILTRVTGNDSSNIRGTLGVLSDADLFLLNPNGIVFGPNAQLDLRGSFIATTADSIQFPNDIEFSAVDPQSPPLLRINVPLGLQYGENPGPIRSQESVLEINPRRSLILAGGAIALNDSDLSVGLGNRGNIVLAGVDEAGTLELTSIGNRWQVDVPDDTARSPITLANTSVEIATGDGEQAGRQIDVYGSDISLLGGSVLFMNRDLDADDADLPTGNIVVDATDNITLRRGFISNRVAPNVVGDGGDVILRGDRLTLRNGSQITASTNGRGDAGAIDINMSEAITLQGTFGASVNGIGNFINTGARGNSGGISLTTNNLSVLDGSLITANGVGTGNTGRITINAQNLVNLDGSGSLIINTLEPLGVGNTGGIEVTSDRLSLFNGALITSVTQGQGNAGDVTINASESILVDGTDQINTQSGIYSFADLGATGSSGQITLTTDTLSILNGARISASTFTTGNAGAIQIDANAIEIRGENQFGGVSAIASDIQDGATGNSGSINIDTDTLLLETGGTISTSTRGEGNAGRIDIEAQDSIDLIGESSLFGITTVINSSVSAGATGSSNGIRLTTDLLSLQDGAVISTSTFGEGNTGLIRINAQDSVILQGNSQDEFGFGSSISSGVGVGANASFRANGDSEGIVITTDRLQLQDGATIFASTFDNGDAGLIRIRARESITLSGTDFLGLGSSISSGVGVDAVGESNGIQLRTDRLSLQDGALISANTIGEGNAGEIRIEVQEELSLSGNNGLDIGSRIASQVQQGAEGSSNGIFITADTLSLTDGATISSDTNGNGNAGIIDLTIADRAVFDGTNGIGTGSGIFSGVLSNATGEAGGVDLTANSLSLTDGAQINASTVGDGDAGLVTLEVNEIVFMQGEDPQGNPTGIASNVFAGASGDAGGIDLTTSLLFVQDGALISASTFGDGRAGDIRVTVSDRIFLRGEDTGIVARTGEDSTGNGGNVIVTNPEFFDVLDEAEISVESRGTGTGGNIRLRSDRLRMDNNSAITAETRSTDGGDITIRIPNQLVLRNGSTISTTAGTDNAGGDGGDINLFANFISTTPSADSDIAANAFAGNGGNVFIATDGLFGIEFREQDTPESDITASSEFGLQGSVFIDQIDIDPTQGLIEFPTNFVDAARLVGRQCPGPGSQVTTASLGEFYLIGRGGIPEVPDPQWPRAVDTIIVDWVTLDDSNPESNNNATPPDNDQSLRPTERPESPLVEATHWQLNEQGQVELVSSTSSEPIVSPLFLPVSCH